MKIALITLGCPKNLVDAEVMLGLLDEAGHTLVASPDGADLAIINTCSFIASAVQESTDVVAGCLDLKQRGRLGRVLVTGCLPQRYGEDVFAMLPGVDGVVGCSDIDKIAGAVEAIHTGGSVTAVHEPIFLYDHTTPRVLGTPDHIAYVKVSEGCDNRCAYCMIPSIRGRLRSRDAISVRCEIDDLARAGVREVNLIAQDTTAYGTDIASAESLAGLLLELDRADIEWIRILYTHPAHLTDGIIDAVASLDSVVPYLDIPIQHVSNHILNAMGRGTDGDHIRGLLRRVRERVPGVWIRSSVMVGFPGETDRDFDELRDLVASGAIDHLGVFEFSPEEGTRAALLGEQIPREVASARACELIELTEALAVERGTTLAGRRLTVLIDEVTPDEVTGRHAGQAWELDGVVRIPHTPDARRGDLIEVDITGPAGFDLEGSIALSDRNRL